LIKGWQRCTVFVYRTDDVRFAEKSSADAIAAALADPRCLMVNRNAGAGTRVLIDKLVERRTASWLQQPSRARTTRSPPQWPQGRADWGIAISTVARLYGLGFLPIAPEDYDFLLSKAAATARRCRRSLAALRDETVREKIRALGMRPADA